MKITVMIMMMPVMILIMLTMHIVKYDDGRVGVCFKLILPKSKKEK